MTRGRSQKGLLASSLGFFFLLPMIPIVLWVFANHWSYPGRLPQNWGLRGITQFRDEGSIAALAKSIFLASMVAVFAVPLSSLAAASLARSKSRAARLVEMLLFWPVVVPPFALVMGLSPWVIRLGVPSQLAVVITLVVLALPYSMFIMRSAYVRYDPLWEDEARLLGATRFGAQRRVRMRIMTRPFLTATAIAFLIGWTDYIVTLVIGGGQLITLPMLAASEASAPGNDSVLALMSIISMALPLLGMALIRRNEPTSTNGAVLR